MGWASTGDHDEVCGDGKDNDSDGYTDERDCSFKRMKFLKAGGRAFLRLAEFRDHFNVGVVSYSSTPTREQSFTTVDSSTISSLENTVDNLSPSKRTAIGDALVETRDMVKDANLKDNAGKWAILFSDGKHNHGNTSPLRGAEELGEEDVRINTMGVGQATQQSTLTDIRTRAAVAATASPMLDGTSDLVSGFALHMAEFLQSEIYVPLLRWKLNADNSTDWEINGSQWHAEQYEQTDAFQGGTGRLSTILQVAPDTGTLTVVIGGALNRVDGVYMDEFGIEARFIAPDGTELDTTNPGGDLQLHRDPYFDIAWIDTPAPGEWEIELRIAEDGSELQQGTLTVYGDKRRMRTGMAVDPRILSSKSGTAEVDAFSDYSTRIREYAPGISVSVEDPTGANVGYSTTQTDSGTIESVIDGLQYRGSHTVEVLYKTSEESQTLPGEPKTPGQKIVRDVPPMTYGQLETLFVEQGDDPGLNFRSESEWFDP